MYAHVDNPPGQDVDITSSLVDSSRVIFGRAIVCPVRIILIIMPSDGVISRIAPDDGVADKLATQFCQSCCVSRQVVLA